MDDSTLGLRVELCVHLGFIKNIDLWQQGVYCVQVTVLAGTRSTLLAPVGIFSAPSRIDSYVGPQRIPALVPSGSCHVNEADKTFRSRAFVVRYKDEEHVRAVLPPPYPTRGLRFATFASPPCLQPPCLQELNDAGHWQFDVVMPASTFSPTTPAAAAAAATNAGNPVGKKATSSSSSSSSSSSAASDAGTAGVGGDDGRYVQSLTVGPGAEAVPLFVKVDLLCCPFDDDAKGQKNGQKAAGKDKDSSGKDKAVEPPTREQVLASPVFKSVASQTLEVQRIGTVPPPPTSSNTGSSSSSGGGSSSSSGSGSGGEAWGASSSSGHGGPPRLLTVGDSVHQYYPVRFDRSHAVDLDCMLHCGVSAVRYPKVRLLAPRPRVVG